MTEQSPEAKSFSYVESLGVNSVYDDAKARRQELDSKMQTLHTCRSRKRELESLKVDVEMQVTEELRGEHPDWSVAEFDRQIKVAFSNEGRIREIRDELVMLQGEIELYEFDISLLEIDIKIATARLHELGGLLQFMAVIKGISAANRSQTKQEGEPA